MSARPFFVNEVVPQQTKQTLRFIRSEGIVLLTMMGRPYMSM